MPKHFMPSISLVAALLVACGNEDAVTSKNTAASGIEDAASAPTGNLPNWFDCVDDAGKVLVSAHRGGPMAGYPENALETLKNTARRLPTPTLLEVDVATSADGVLFLHHDDLLNRTTTGNGVAGDATWADLSTLNLVDKDGNRTKHRLARLDDALRWAEGKAILQLDIKRSTDYDDVARVVKAAGAEERVMVIGYTPGQVFALARRLPNTMISAPVETLADLETYAARGVALDQILAWTGTETPQPEYYAQLDRENIEVIFGTLGGRNSIDNAIAASGDVERYATLGADGVDILATDKPGTAAAVLAKAGILADYTTCQ